VLASVYVPKTAAGLPRRKMAFLDAMIRGRRPSRSRRRVVVCGDVNIAPRSADVHPKERKRTRIGQRPDERATFAAAPRRGARRRRRRSTRRTTPLFTWWAAVAATSGSGTSGGGSTYVLASEPLARTARSCAVLREFGTSDHGPVIGDVRRGV